MALDGIMFEGVSVRVRRPNDYNPAAAAALGPAVPNPVLNLSAIGLHPGGMNAVRSPVLTLFPSLCVLTPVFRSSAFGKASVAFCIYYLASLLLQSAAQTPRF